MTFPKPKSKQNIIFAIVGISVVAIALSFGMTNSCGIQHVSIIEDIKTFDNTQDPELCAATVIKILEFNEECEPYIEILDCG